MRRKIELIHDFLTEMVRSMFSRDALFVDQTYSNAETMCNKTFRFLESAYGKYHAEFAILLSLQVPSIIVSLFIFLYFGYHRRTRINEYNQSMLFLLIINFVQVLTDLPMPINFYHFNGKVFPRTAAYCTAWVWYEFSLNTINACLMAWISIERHLLVFHPNFTRATTSCKRRLKFTVPLIICCIWGPIFYCVTVIISPMCQSEWNYEALICGIPCYLLTNWGAFDLFFNILLSTCIIMFSNLGLCIRVAYQYLAVSGRQVRRWNRQKKLAIQLTLISLVYLSAWVPISIAQLGQIYIDRDFLVAEYETLSFFIYIAPPLLSIIYFISMPELNEIIRKLTLQQERLRVHPFQQQPTQR